MIIVSLIVFCLLCWIGFTCGVIVLKLAYLFCIGLPLAAVIAIVGILLCCTIILIPVGVALLNGARLVLYPF